MTWLELRRYVHIAVVIESVRLMSSMPYQIRPPEVTSNCHCSTCRSPMLMTMTLRLPLRRC